MDTFIDRKVGILGYVDEMDVRTFRAPPRVQMCDDPESWRTPFDVSLIERAELPRVEILIGYQEAGLDEAVLAWADAGVDGIVLAGGGVSQEARAAAEAKGVVFTSTSRFRSGGDNLMPQKARLLLLLALAFSEDREQVAAWIDEIGGLEFNMTRNLPMMTSER
jgi:L-asparaginase